MYRIIYLCIYLFYILFFSLIHIFTLIGQPAKEILSKLLDLSCSLNCLKTVSGLQPTFVVTVNDDDDWLNLNHVIQYLSNPMLKIFFFLICTTE